MPEEEKTREEQPSIEGLKLSGEEVEQLNDKTFTIHAMPFYDIFKEEGKEDKKSLVVPVQLANGTVADWYANKTSQKVITAARGRLLAHWVDYKGEFIVKDQRVGKDDRKVIYLKE